MSTVSPVRVLLLVLSAAALFLAGAALLRPASETASAAGTHAAPGEAAMRATIDPETGVLGVASGSDLVLSGEIQESLRRDTQGLERVTHPDGSSSVHLQGRFQSASVARLGEDGKLVFCSEEPDDLSAGPQAPAAKAVQ